MRIQTGGGSIHRLAPRQVLAAKQGDLNDGGGLVLRVSAAGSGSWVLRYSVNGKRREMGFGVAYRDSLAQAGASLTAARDQAAKAREQLRQGIDPLLARQAQRQAADEAEQASKAEKQREHWTLARCARDYHERVIEPTKTTKHAAQWISSLENHMPTALWHSPIDAIEPPALLRALLAVKPHERARRLTDSGKLDETVQRMRQRLEAVFEDALFHRRCTSNPAAAVKRKLREASGRRVRTSFRALPYGEAPALMAELRAADGLAARCLEFTVITASRTSEALLAEWSEFDLDAKVWTVPATRMKVVVGDVDEQLLSLPGGDRLAFVGTELEAVLERLSLTPSARGGTSALEDLLRGLGGNVIGPRPSAAFHGDDADGGEEDDEDED